jgi:hypothetical protein
VEARRGDRENAAQPAGFVLMQREERGFCYGELGVAGIDARAIRSADEGRTALMVGERFIDEHHMILEFDGSSR